MTLFRMTNEIADSRSGGNMAGGPAPGHPASEDEVAQRLARYAASRQPTDLWPGTSEVARVAAARELERVVRAQLAGDRALRLDPDSVHEPYALSVAGQLTGVGALLGHWIERGELAARDEVAAWCALHLAHARRRWERMSRDVLPAFDALLAAGITPVVVKGFHTAVGFFDEPALRRMADVDIVVPASRIADVEQALRTAGFTPTTDAIKPYRRDWRSPTVDGVIRSLDVAHEGNPWTLEVHASLDRFFHPGATARLDGERSCVEPFDVAGRPLLALAQPLRLITLAAHCSQELDGSRLLRLFELVTVIRRDRSSGLLAWPSVAAMLQRTRSARYCYPAFALADVLAPGAINPGMLALAHRESTWAARHTVARLAPSGGSTDHRGVLQQWMWTRGPVALAQRLLRNLWPASFTRPRDALAGWRVRLRRLRSGALSVRAPNERAAVTPPAPRREDAPPTNATPL